MENPRFIVSNQKEHKELNMHFGAQTNVHIKMVPVSIVTACLILRQNTNTHSYLEALWCIFFYRVLYLNNWISICKKECILSKQFCRCLLLDYVALLIFNKMIF